MMDDLSRVSWAPTKPSTETRGPGQAQAQAQAQSSKSNYYPALRPTPPLFGRSPPSDSAANGVSQNTFPNSLTGSKSSRTNNDSFANLVTFNASQSTTNLSLQEQQRLLQEQKAKAEDDRGRNLDSFFGASHVLNASTNSSRASSPYWISSNSTNTDIQKQGNQKLINLAQVPSPGIPNDVPYYTPKTPIDNEADTFAAFSSSAPAEKAGHAPVTRTRTGLETDSESAISTLDSSQAKVDTLDDDDPFGLGIAAHPKPVVSRTERAEDGNDDVLGLLNRPVSEFSISKSSQDAAMSPIPTSFTEPLDQAMAELIDMGFSPDKSKLALESTESGSDVQAAVGLLLSQAHDKSRKEHNQQGGSRRDSIGGHKSRRTIVQRKGSESGASRPAWMQEQGRSGQRSKPRESRSPSRGEKEPAQYAQEIGNNLFKTANSIWKTGTKKFSQAVAELNSDSDASQPKWMRDSNGELESRKTRTRKGHHNADGDVGMRRRREDFIQQDSPSSKRSVTAEALMLESSSIRPGREQSTQPKPKQQTSHSESATDHRQLSAKREEVSPPKPKFLQQSSGKDQKSKLSRQAIEEGAAQAYISPARRRKPAARQTFTPRETQPDSLFTHSNHSFQETESKSVPETNMPTDSRSDVQDLRHERKQSLPKRVIPPISPSAMQLSSVARRTGTAAFKRGDYAEATDHYSKTLSLIPPRHPLILPTLTNRALSHLKIGDPKASIADAKTVLEFIGPSRGVGEVIDMGGEEGIKQMDVYWGKAMTRKAEALEQLEKWDDAATSWRACVEVGVGGATSIAGRNRCENASKPKPPAPAKRPPSKANAKSSAFNNLAPESGLSAEAVIRLRAANAAADKLDDEKFKLADQVDARLTKWRTGKESNLRALLSSLETVLWESAGWKKVGMGDVLAPNKVKIIYMKGIAKVHPDKVSLLSTQYAALLLRSMRLR